MSSPRVPLTRIELVALAGLLHELGRADPNGAASQANAAIDLADELSLLRERDDEPGGSPYRNPQPPASPLTAEEWLAIRASAARSLAGREPLRPALRAIKRPEARRAIHAIAYDIATHAHITPEEWNWLAWLEEEWSLR